MSKPKPFDVKKFEDLYLSDYFDENVPNGGFISDFVLSLRLTEAPTLFAVWTAIFLMSSAIKREAWMSWGPFGKLFANLYIIMVAPAGSKKSSAINFGDKILRNMPKYIDDPNLRRIKKLRVIKNKATPESMLELMVPDESGPGVVFDDNKEPCFHILDANGQKVPDGNGGSLKYRLTSETCLILSELSVMMGKQQYTESLIQNLLDLYDCEDKWEWRTVKRGTKYLRRLYTTLIGATTVDGFRSSIPQAAMGDGFLSRTVLAYAPVSTRVYPEPMTMVGAPTLEDLSKSLAWISEHTKGEYRFSKEGTERFNEWYADYKQDLKTRVGNAGVFGRMDLNVRKVAFFLHAQKYKGDEKVIDLHEVEGAIRLVEATYSTVDPLLTDLNDDGIETKSESSLQYIKKHGKITRDKLRTNKRLKALDMDKIVDYLSMQGKIKIMYDGKRHRKTTQHGNEEYLFVPGRNLGGTVK